MSSSQAVFLSYAHEDSDAARRIADALRCFGLEVWFDRDELRGGDAWDASIRRQIHDCALFIPLISAHTEARAEGYFRREWKLAVERTNDMAEGVPFLVPVVVDETPDAGAMVPEAFLRIQWTRLPAGEPDPKFVERIRHLLEKPRRSAVAASGRPFAGPPRTTEDGRQRAEDSGRRAEDGGRTLFSGSRWMAAAAVAVGVGIAGFFTFRPTVPATPNFSEPKQPASNSPSSNLRPADSKSIAVLPFANLSDDKSTEYFSDGITEEILNALARDPELRVAARTSSFAFKGKNTAIDEIGRALRAASVIEGSVRKSGNRVRITVQLITAADGYHVWSETFDREMTDIFAVQDEIAAKVAQKLAGGPVASARPNALTAFPPTKNLAAYDAYLRGRAAQTRGGSPELVDEAIRHYNEAVRLDPDYAEAWARLAQVFAASYWDNHDRTNEIANQARAAAATALRLDPNLPEVHVALASIHQQMDYDFDAAQRELDQVERLRPNDAEIPAAQAALEFARGNWGEEMIALAALAAERDSQNALTILSIGDWLATIGKFTEADRLFDRAWVGQAFPAPIRLKALATVAWTGDVAAGLALLETCPGRIRNEWFHHTLAELTALRGDPAAAIAVNDLLRTIMRRERPNFGRRHSEAVATYRMGWHHARAGNPARAEGLYAEAAELAEKLAADFPQESEPRFNLALIQARRGHKAAALATAEEAMGLARRTHDARRLTEARQAKAEVLAALGQTGEAVAELRAVQDMGYAFGYWLRLDLRWEPLRTDAKFQQLTKDAEARADAVPRPRK